MSDLVSRALLEQRWPLPEPSGSKHSRGDVVVVGGARKTPGAAILAGIAALRTGAGRITLCVAESVASATAVALPECAEWSRSRRRAAVPSPGAASTSWPANSPRRTSP
ncbi:NAD(P)H-hydrate dehydratase [Rathayibacter rathayi]|uniref:NAD(P)H-hydrate dehydratase n=1 Tax=Rathayibacter rathayi TaxID=33887 RepID=UPI00301B859B